MSSVVAVPTECPNCTAPIHGAFCAQCGQKAAHPDPTLHDLLHEFTHEVLHLDGKIFQSIWMLFTRPGRLTKEYIQGRRSSYVGPLRLYLTFSVIAFALLSMEPPPRVEVRPRAPAKGLEFSTTPVKRSGFSLSSVNISEAEASKLFAEALHDWLPRVMFVLVPLCAFFVKVLTRKTKRNYPQHFYFALHLHAAYFGLLALTAIPSAFHIAALDRSYGGLRVGLTFIYALVAFRTVYGGSWLRSAWRSGVLIVGYMFWVLVAVGGILAIAGAKAARAA